MISLLSSAVLLGSLSLINGQTFPGFIYQPSQELVVDYSGTVLNYSGEYLVKDRKYLHTYTWDIFTYRNRC
jgi:hypothetical protein